jgi:hypothetical protein
MAVMFESNRSQTLLKKSGYRKGQSIGWREPKNKLLLFGNLQLSSGVLSPEPEKQSSPVEK